MKNYFNIDFGKQYFLVFPSGEYSYNGCNFYKFLNSHTKYILDQIQLPFFDDFSFFLIQYNEDVIEQILKHCLELVDLDEIKANLYSDQALKNSLRLSLVAEQQSEYPRSFLPNITALNSNKLPEFIDLYLPPQNSKRYSFDNQDDQDLPLSIRRQAKINQCARDFAYIYGNAQNQSFAFDLVANNQITSDITPKPKQKYIVSGLPAFSNVKITEGTPLNLTKIISEHKKHKETTKANKKHPKGTHIVKEHAVEEDLFTPPQLVFIDNFGKTTCIDETQALYILSLVYREGYKDFYQDRSLSIDLCTIAALRGLKKAQYDLAKYYIYSEVADKNDNLIICDYWLQKAVEQDYIPAYLLFIKRNIFNMNKNKDLQQAIVSCFDHLIQFGSHNAALALGMLIDQGQYLSLSSAQAITYFEKAIVLGCKRAPIALGLHYLQGIGVKADAEYAFKLFCSNLNEDNFGLAYFVYKEALDYFNETHKYYFIKALEQSARTIVKAKALEKFYVFYRLIEYLYNTKNQPFDFYIASKMGCLPLYEDIKKGAQVWTYWSFAGLDVIAPNLTAQYIQQKSILPHIKDIYDTEIFVNNIYKHKDKPLYNFNFKMQQDGFIFIDSLNVYTHLNDCFRNYRDNCVSYIYNNQDYVVYPKSEFKFNKLFNLELLTTYGESNINQTLQKMYDDRMVAFKTLDAEIKEISDLEDLSKNKNDGSALPLVEELQVIQKKSKTRHLDTEQAMSKARKAAQKEIQKTLKPKKVTKKAKIALARKINAKAKEEQAVFNDFINAYDYALEQQVKAECSVDRIDFKYFVIEQAVKLIEILGNDTLTPYDYAYQEIALIIKNCSPEIKIILLGVALNLMMKEPHLHKEKWKDIQKNPSNYKYIKFIKFLASCNFALAKYILAKLYFYDCCKELNYLKEPEFEIVKSSNVDNPEQTKEQDLDLCSKILQAQNLREQRNQAKKLKSKKTKSSIAKQSKHSNTYTNFDELLTENEITFNINKQLTKDQLLDFVNYDLQKTENNLLRKIKQIYTYQSDLLDNEQQDQSTFSINLVKATPLTKNEKLAMVVALLQEASDFNAHACCFLAYLYSQGIGVNQDDKICTELILKSINIDPIGGYLYNNIPLPCIESCLYYVFLLLEGKYVLVDYQTSFNFCIKAFNSIKSLKEIQNNHTEIFTSSNIHYVKPESEAITLISLAYFYLRGICESRNDTLASSNINQAIEIYKVVDPEIAQYLTNFFAQPDYLNHFIEMLRFLNTHNLKPQKSYLNELYGIDIFNPSVLSGFYSVLPFIEYPNCCEHIENILTAYQEIYNRHQKFTEMFQPLKLLFKEKEVHQRFDYFFNHHFTYICSPLSLFVEESIKLKQIFLEQNHVEFVQEKRTDEEQTNMAPNFIPCFEENSEEVDHILSLQNNGYDKLLQVKLDRFGNYIALPLSYINLDLNYFKSFLNSSYVHLSSKLEKILRESLYLYSTEFDIQKLNTNLALTSLDDLYDDKLLQQCFGISLNKLKESYVYLLDEDKAVKETTAFFKDISMRQKYHQGFRRG